MKTCRWRMVSDNDFPWKLVIFSIAAVATVFLVLAGFDRSFSYYSLQFDPFLDVWSKEELCWPKSPASSAAFPRHYPKPSKYSRKECLCTPVHYFVLLSTQRSGSGWFETLLNSHPSISCHGEVFSVKPRRHGFSAISHTLDDVYNLDWYSSAAKNSCTAAVGLKWMLNQGALEYSKQASSYFQRRGISVILLLRRNALKRLISIMANSHDRSRPVNGTHVAHVHSEEEAEKLASYRPTIDIKSLRTSLQDYQDMVNQALQAYGRTRFLEIYYEDLVKEPQKLQTTVQEFLGVETRQLQSKHVKIHKGPLSQSVTNWEAVSQELNGTLFQEFLADDDYDELGAGVHNSGLLPP